MRIAFLGKGGSGKTTISAGFIKYLTDFKKLSHVTAIDADINVHLAKSLGIEQDPIWLGSKFDEVTAYVRGDRDDIKTMVPTTPPSIKSKYIKNIASDQFLQKFAIQKDNLSLLTIGSFHVEDVGHSCYHGKLNTLEVLFHHLLDGKDDVVVADVIAGTDNMGTSLFMVYDLNVVVVEPTLKSIQVYLDFEKMSQKHDLPFLAVGNKIRNEHDLEFIHKHVAKEKLITVFHNNQDLIKFEQGDKSGFQKFVAENAANFEQVFIALQKFDKNWEKYLKRLNEVHKINALEWWNNYYKEDIDKQADNKFSYFDVL